MSEGFVPEAAAKPPLWAWMLAAAITVAVMLALASLHRWPGHSWQSQRPAILHLQRLDHVPAGAMHVVAMGSSKTLHALDHDQRFLRRLAAPAGSVAFTRITVSGAGFMDLQPALAALQRRPPALLLVEEDLLVFHRGKRSWLGSLLADARSNLLGLLSLSSGGSRFPDYAKNRGGEEWATAMRCRQRKLPDAMRVYGAYAAQWRTTRPAEQKQYLDLLRPMQAAGTRVVLIGLPRAPSAEPWVPARLKSDADALRAQLASVHGLPHWSPGPMPEALYCDPGHLNRAGREHYGEWLAGQLRHAMGWP